MTQIIKKPQQKWKTTTQQKLTTSAIVETNEHALYKETAKKSGIQDQRKDKQFNKLLRRCNGGNL